MRRRRWSLYTVLAFGYAFLYLPVLLLVVYSFNASRLVTVWSGFSVKWYGELLHNRQLLDAAWLSIRIAATNATFAVVLGTLAANALVRHGRFRGRTGFELLLTAPLVMPDVIIGLSLLLLFVALQQLVGWPAGRGFTTITIAHITFSLAYVAVVVRARLAQMDRSLEEAAMDLGARPLTVYQRITLPLIAPALLSGWLLAFTLSLDDLVIASFVSGPGATTLPMVVYASVRMGVSPQINALATLIVVFVAVAVTIATLTSRGLGSARTNCRRTRD
ncbi:ABC-type spermidine/putrescine transport system, permease component II [Thioflavicoccus mobilis 8321]|uniref:ABC-type spermidine/putrescine transport system, permease component II n=1 Tax=Thioflavicoccus mobilis 8321 TaxID=765912 RepID=L0GWM5_9GAMM|nr:ABC transporter permease subunit [Thioflavicoccus mobilis]AGA89770.1 ABC-type spermidine/putrescine transport system, permease component II [Thioflavicoccus mobilis 8321]